MRAWWSGMIAEFQAANDEDVLGVLSTRLVETHSINHETQIRAWRGQIAILRHAMIGLPRHYRMVFEYPLLRLGRRIDAVLLTQGAIVVLEFKITSTVTEADSRQVEDYALDLHDFHSASRAHPIVPILIHTGAKIHQPAWPLCWYGVTPVLATNQQNLADLLREIDQRCIGASHAVPMDAWESAAYRPVPTIVEAARMLYARHNISDIRAARADVVNLSRTREAISAVIEDARNHRHHVVLFVTGIPGAGKTLCGLDAVFSFGQTSAFLTGNFPLIYVMRAALERDARAQGRNVRVAKQETESAIQPLMGFLKDNLDRTDPPHEHVIVFDEAQRAWDAAFGARKFGHLQSEAAMFLDIMARHTDWSAIVALVGNGQEINTGEAGLAAWGEALSTRRDWRVHASATVLSAADQRQALSGIAPERVSINDDLHLDVAVRSIRSDIAVAWVEAVLAGDRDRACGLAAETEELPFLLTRSLQEMRSYLRSTARGERRCGLVCSAGARRLRADGINANFPHMEADVVANWFLNRWPDVRASDALEVPATQFACQGLELDHVGLCWGNDMIRRPGAGAWLCRSFVGDKWQRRRNETENAFRVNTYRVLLTRARYSTVIWVPIGAHDDITRSPAEFNAIADFLSECGARPLSHAPMSASEPIRQGLLL